MTTIAASVIDGVMCSDTLWTDGDECGPMRKVWRVRGELLGVAGELGQARVWIAAWRRARFDTITGCSSLSVLLLSRVSILAWTQRDGWLPVGSKFAIGSGSKAARGAMAAGATCRQAVRIAIGIDAGTGGQVRSYKL